MEDLITKKQMRTILSSLKDYINSIELTSMTLYSTNEQRIGTWIDGNPLYQITIQGTTPPTIDTESNFCSVDIGDYIIISLEGFIKTSTTDIYINCNDNDKFIMWGSDGGKNIKCKSIIQDTCNCKGYVTIKYLKIHKNHTLSLLHLNSDTTDEFSTTSIWRLAGSSATINTTNPKFGTGCCKVSGEGYLISDSDSKFNFGYNDFTVECWFKADQTDTNQSIFAKTSDFRLGAFLSGNRILYFMSSNGGSWNLISGDSDAYNGIGSHNVSANVWHHFAYVRKGTKIYGFLDGQKDLEVTIGNVAIVSNNLPITFGRWGNGGYFLDGYFDEIRISDIARYTEDFTPQTEPFDDVYGE